MQVFQITEQALAGKVICNIGQVTVADKRELEKLVKAGTLTKWRGFWHPIAGAPIGIGPAKTCWGTPEARAAVFS